MEKYSQNEEQSFVLGYFEDYIGRFLEIGAMDGRCFSNCYALSQLGWRGVCLEPDPQAFEGLKRIHGDNEKIVTIEAALGPTDGTVVFHSNRGGGVSTTSDAHREKWASAATFETIRVRSISVATLLERHPGPYEMVSVDAESTSVELLEMLPLFDMGAELVVAEHDGMDDRVKSHCAKHGLNRVIHRNGENLIIAK